ncbi:MAG TPA: rhomboid family intramembrane serine protease, partial [Armatimonadota bacterium]|nr:rhomboid family intramembrane serine protease [Armatimonadota bacterium]
DTNRPRTRPVVMYALVLINALVFLYELGLSQPQLNQFVAAMGVIPAHFSTSKAIFSGSPPAVLDLFTSMFIHGGWMHILFNMWYLFIFGDNVEDRMGHGRFLLFYLLGGVVAGISHILLNWGSPVPSIGASGAIAAVLGAYLVLFPRAKVLTVVFLFFLWVTELPAIIVLGFWFVGQLFSGLGSLGVVQNTGVAYWAHIGGFLFGVLTVSLFTPRHRMPGSYYDRRYGGQGNWWPGGGWERDDG